MSLAKQLASARSLDTQPACNVPKRMDDKKDISGFEGIVIAEKVLTYGICCKLHEVQHICENGGEALLTIVVEVI